MRDTLEKSLKRIFRESSGKDRRRWGCLTEAEVASFADGTVKARERKRIEDHLERCAYCREQVAFLYGLKEAELPPAVPAGWMATARELAQPKRKGLASWQWRWGAVAAAAACLVLVVVTVILRRPSQETRSLPKLSPRSGSAVRGGSSLSSLPELIFPTPQASVSAAHLQFRWEPVKGAREYEIDVVTAAGDLAWSGKTEKTSAQLPSGVSLSPGQKYYVWIRAYLREDKVVQSGAVPFVISAP